MSERLELLIRNGSVVTPEGVSRADLAVVGGRIVEVSSSITDSAVLEIDAAGFIKMNMRVEDARKNMQPGRVYFQNRRIGNR